MARVVIDLPASFLFSTDLPLRVSDLNYANHLGNDRVLALVQEVRMQWLRSHGLKRCSEIGVGGTRQQASSRARPEVARFSHL